MNPRRRSTGALIRPWNPLCTTSTPCTRAPGAQTPFSSINYGTDTSDEGRLVIRNILLATEAGLGHGETPIFPIQIFKLKAGVNYNPGDPNYDLFELACRCSAKRLFPNFVNLDAPYNLQSITCPAGPRRRWRPWAAAPV